MTLVFTILASGGYVAGAQELKWLQDSIDLGTFQDMEGVQKACYRFVNCGKESVAINRVQTSCGCTAAKYPKEEVLPGDTAAITVGYNPEGMMGRFRKTIRVYSGPDNHEKRLIITGKVLTNGKHMLERYPYSAGPLHFSRDSIWLGDVQQGSAKTEFIHAYNSSEDTLRIGWKNENKCVLITSSDSVVEPGDAVTFSIYYNSLFALEPGPDMSDIIFYADEQKHPEWQLRMPIGANVTEVKDNIPPDRIADSPRIDYEPVLIDLGRQKKDKVVNVKFKIRNTGHAPLEVGRIYATDLGSACPLCPIKKFKVTSYKKVIKPGKTGDVKARLWLDDLSLHGQGAFNLMLEVKSNDPRHARNQGNVHIVGQIVE